MNKKAVNLSLYTMLLAGIICGCSERMGVVDANKSVTDKSPKTISKEIKPVKEKQIILKDKLIYTNLNSKPAIDEVRLALRQSGIKDEYINNVFEWVADYNTCMKDCKEFSLVGDFTTVSAKAIDYGDWYKMSKEWFKKNNRNYHDVLCRVVAFQLNQENITTEKTVKKADFDCWDEDKSWLYTDGDILFGRKPTEEDHYGCIPFPLLSWDDKVMEKYFTIFNPVFVKKKCNEEEMLKAIKKRWDDYGVSFEENSHSLVTLWQQVDNEIAVSHAGTLVETDYGFLFFEKTNPEEPYAATKFADIERVKSYLYEKIKLEYSKDGSEFGKYIILKNDKRI